MGGLVGLRALGNLLGLFWFSSGRASAPAVLAVLQAVVKVVLALWLVHDYGILGVLIASIATAAIQVTALSLLLALRSDLPPNLIRNAAWLGLLSTAAGAFGSEAAAAASTPMFLAGVLATVAFWAVVWMAAVRTSSLGAPLGRLRGLSALIPSGSGPCGDRAR
jgi:O-antigen/teichoic acid export membrane protein